MKKTARKVIAAFLALAITAGTLPMALASDTLPYLGESARGENQAFQHGYRAEDFLDWSPERILMRNTCGPRFLCRTATQPWQPPRPTRS